MVAQPGICARPSCDWSPSREYALAPCAIGRPARNMLSPLVRLVTQPGICSRPSCDWSPSQEYVLAPRVIGRPARNTLSPLVRLVTQPGICSRPSHDWSPSQEYADMLSPLVCGAHVHGQLQAGAADRPVPHSEGGLQAALQRHAPRRSA
eukprot:808797-Prorocentrum_minimum.AAC.1